MLVNGRKYPMPSPFPISTPNPPSVLPVPLHRFYYPPNQLLNEPNPLLNLLLPHVSRLLALLMLPVYSYLPEGLFHHGVKPLLANSGLKAIPALGELMLPPCGLRPSLGFIQVYLTLHWGSPV
jgi:hypothetical protein